jgi:hypothetical protein
MPPQKGSGEERTLVCLRQQIAGVPAVKCSVIRDAVSAVWAATYRVSYRVVCLAGVMSVSPVLLFQMIEEEEIEVPVTKSAEPTPMDTEGDKKEEASTAAADADIKMDDAEAGTASEKQTEGGAANGESKVSCFKGEQGRPVGKFHTSGCGAFLW